MRKLAFVIGIIGLGFLVGFLLNEPFYVESLDGLIVGDIVKIQGIVDEQRRFGNGKLLTIRNISVFCECMDDYAGLDVVVSGIVEKFPQDLRVKAFSVQILD
ncbi:MAG: hypothetical protein AABX23_03350 [Nanoarchaeota archaeon]